MWRINDDDDDRHTHTQQNERNRKKEKREICKQTNENNTVFFILSHFFSLRSVEQNREKE
jgi:hypothetical protein